MFSRIEEDETYLNRTVFSMKKHFMYVEQSTGTIAMYGVVNTLAKCLNMSIIHRRGTCAMLWWKTSVMFVRVWVLICDERQCFASHPAGTIFQLDGALPLTSSIVCMSLDRKEGIQIPATLILQIFRSLLLGLWKDICLLMRDADCESVSWNNC
jgi:hypothetical protein